MPTGALLRFHQLPALLDGDHGGHFDERVFSRFHRVDGHGRVPSPRRRYENDVEVIALEHAAVVIFPARITVGPRRALLTSEAFVENARANPGLAAMREQYETALVNVKKLHEAGITIGLGTDSGTTNRFPGYFEHREIELLVDAGLTPQQAIAAVTRNSAEALGHEGTLRVGAPAGFVLLRSDPLSDVRNTRDIEAVYFDGKKIDRGASGASD